MMDFSGIPLYKSWLVDEGIALIVNNPRSLVTLSGITEGPSPFLPTEVNVLGPSGRKTYDLPNDINVLQEFGGDAPYPGHDDRFLIWQAKGWLWFFDTEWKNTERREADRQRIVRLQNIFGCANVALGPPAQMKDNGKWRPGVWCRLTEHQAVRHREPSLCRCKTGKAERGEFDG